MSRAHNWRGRCHIAGRFGSQQRAQSGNRAVSDVWAEYRHSMPFGLPREGEGGMDQTPTWARTYWGGALYCLQADVGHTHDVGDDAHALGQIDHGDVVGDLACEAGIETSACMVRKIAIFLFRYRAFGILALVAAVCHLLRPQIYAFALGMVAAAFGLVLYNNGLAALATALLVISFARPVIVDIPPPAAAAARRTTGPASSKGPR